MPSRPQTTNLHRATVLAMLKLCDLVVVVVAFVLSLVAAAALVALAWHGATLPAEQRLARAGLALIVGGAAGNLIDRLRAGYVVDFVDLYWRGWHFWAFNVADAAITVGVSLMILDLLHIGRRRVSRAV